MLTLQVPISLLFIEYFVIEVEDESFDKTLESVNEMCNEIEDIFHHYQECFQNPAEFTGDVEGI